MVDKRMANPSGLVNELIPTGDGLNREPESLSDTLRGASDDVAKDVKQLGDRAVGALGEQAEEIRGEAAAGLAAFFLWHPGFASWAYGKRR